MSDVRNSVRHRALNLALLVLLCGVLTVTLQRWVGYSTIYADDVEQKRLMLHNAILHNQLPAGKQWGDLGAVQTSTRVFTVYLAEGIHRVTRTPVLTIYVMLDTVALFCTLLAVFVYLGAWTTPTLGLVGLLYFAFVMVLTYQLHYFHPWDRLSLLCWILGVILIREDRFIPLLLLLPVAITVKWDIVVLPVLYGLAHWSRGSYRSVMVRTAALVAVSSVTLLALVSAFPVGADRADDLWQIIGQDLSRNRADLAALNAGYPPLLAFGIPLLLASFGLRFACRFLRASFVFAISLFIPFILYSNFAEVRAQMMILALILPTALIGLTRLLNASGEEGGGLRPLGEAPYPRRRGER